MRAGLLVLVAGCFDPSPMAGAPCGANDTCPSTLVCTEGRCLLPGVGADARDDATLAGVKEGSIFATVVQQPYEFGYQSVQLMAKVLGGDRSVIPAGKLKIIPTLIITRDNVTLKVNAVIFLRSCAGGFG